MQTSGTFPGLSDGVKKTVTTSVPRAPKVAPPAAPTPVAVPKTSSHRAGGHAKHTRRSK